MKVSSYFRYLIDLDLLNYADDHWIPIYLFCTPCLLRYDIIAKVGKVLKRHSIPQVQLIKFAKIIEDIKL